MSYLLRRIGGREVVALAGRSFAAKGFVREAFADGRPAFGWLLVGVPSPAVRRASRGDKYLLALISHRAGDNIIS